MVALGTGRLAFLSTFPPRPQSLHPPFSLLAKSRPSFQSPCPNFPANFLFCFAAGDTHIHCMHSSVQHTCERKGGKRERKGRKMHEKSKLKVSSFSWPPATSALIAPPAGRLRFYAATTATRDIVENNAHMPPQQE